MRLKQAISILLLAALMGGCTQNTLSGNALDRLEDLEEQVRYLQKAEYAESLERPDAILETTAKGYCTVRTRSGYFFVSIDRIEPYLDGHKVFVRIGNPMFATFGDLNLTVRWGSNYLILQKPGFKVRKK